MTDGTLSRNISVINSENATPMMLPFGFSSFRCLKRPKPPTKIQMIWNEPMYLSEISPINKVRVPVTPKPIAPPNPHFAAGGRDVIHLPAVRRPTPTAKTLNPQQSRNTRSGDVTCGTGDYGRAVRLFLGSALSAFDSREENRCCEGHAPIDGLLWVH